jgi:sugar-specific transcriptional regulator TrmB
MNVFDGLKGLGLTRKEQDAYLGLLELGEGTVAHVAQKSGLKRPTAYLVIDSLKEKGLVTEFARGKRTFYSAEHPKKLVLESELRLTALKESIPQLESLFTKGEKKPKVVVYEGKEALDRAFDEMFVTKGEPMFISTYPLSSEAFPRSYRKAEYVVYSKDFHTRELTDQSPEALSYAKKIKSEYREIRFLPKEMLPFEADVSIFGNNVIISSVKENFFAVKLESEPIARAFRSMFMALWNLGSES